MSKNFFYLMIPVSIPILTPTPLWVAKFGSRSQEPKPKSLSLTHQFGELWQHQWVSILLLLITRGSPISIVNIRVSKINVPYLWLYALFNGQVEWKACRVFNNKKNLTTTFLTTLDIQTQLVSLKYNTHPKWDQTHVHQVS